MEERSINSPARSRRWQFVLQGGSVKTANRIFAAGAAVLLSGAIALAEEHGAPKAKGKSMTMTGCLTKGADQPQHYSFTDQKSGKKWTVTGPADLEKHSANHTVRISGQETAKVFNVTKVEHVSPTCDAKAAAADK